MQRAQKPAIPPQSADSSDRQSSSITITEPFKIVWVILKFVKAHQMQKMPCVTQAGCAREEKGLELEFAFFSYNGVCGTKNRSNAIHTL